ncbi:unnamed protein product [Cylicocyclus nassatus]|uniref:Lipoprotein n=1 Tax=Cylicocyclus nassatus TaxID=53992 RepID=A0AA36H089_CYLNA|nr:unnamed protein product [Cylicocyclus nassatus]
MLYKIFLLLILTYTASACFSLSSCLKGSSEENGFDYSFYADCDNYCFHKYKSKSEYKKCLAKCVKESKPKKKEAKKAAKTQSSHS